MGKVDIGMPEHLRKKPISQFTPEEFKLFVSLFTSHIMERAFPDGQSR